MNKHQCINRRFDRDGLVASVFVRLLLLQHHHLQYLQQLLSFSLLYSPTNCHEYNIISNHSELCIKPEGGATFAVDATIKPLILNYPDNVKRHLHRSFYDCHPLYPSYAYFNFTQAKSTTFDDEINQCAGTPYSDQWIFATTVLFANSYLSCTPVVFNSQNSSF